MEIALALGFGFLLGAILSALGTAAIACSVDKRAVQAGVWVVDGCPYKLTKMDAAP